MSSLLSLLGRGMAAGGVAGLISGGFSFLLAEPLMDRAVRLEAAKPWPAGRAVESSVEVFTRATQHVGLLVATTLAGLALGVLFAVVYAALYRRDVDDDPWGRSLRLAAAAFTGVWLLPFLRYPANPPGVGEAGTVALRANGWLAAIAISLFAVIAAWRIHTYLADRGAAAPARQLAAAAILVAALAALYLLPDNPDPVDVPAGLLWNFRLLSAASVLLLWAGLAVGFGLAGLHAGRAGAESSTPSGS